MATLKTSRALWNIMAGLLEKFSAGLSRLKNTRLSGFKFSLSGQYFSCKTGKAKYIKGPGYTPRPQKQFQVTLKIGIAILTRLSISLIAGRIQPPTDRAGPGSYIRYLTGHLFPSFTETPGLRLVPGCVKKAPECGNSFGVNLEMGKRMLQNRSQMYEAFSKARVNFEEKEKHKKTALKIISPQKLRKKSTTSIIKRELKNDLSLSDKFVKFGMYLTMTNYKTFIQKVMNGDICMAVIRQQYWMQYPSHYA